MKTLLLCCRANFATGYGECRRVYVDADFPDAVEATTELYEARGFVVIALEPL